MLRWSKKLESIFLPISSKTQPIKTKIQLSSLYETEIIGAKHFWTKKFMSAPIRVVRKAQFFIIFLSKNNETTQK
jgi:hypothetical protein